MVEQLHYNSELNSTVLRIVSDVFDSNVYILDNNKDNQVVVIDPSEEYNKKLIDWLKEKNKKVSNCLITHEHFDHHAGLKQLLNYNGSLNIMCSIETKLALLDSKKNLSFFFNKNISLETLDNLSFDLSLEEIEMLKTPGHSKGSTCFQFENLFFSGDTIIETDYLVTKLPGGSKKDLQTTLQFLSHKLTSQDQIIVFPGHGEPFKFKKWINENT